MKRIFLLLLVCSTAAGQQLAPLTIEKIMRDPKWIGVAPSFPFWSSDSKTLYFNWNPENEAGDSLYRVTTTDHAPRRVSPAIRRMLPPSFAAFNKAHTKRVFEKNGDIYIQEIAANRIIQVFNTTAREQNPSFSQDEKKLFFQTELNLFSWEQATGAVVQYTDFKKGVAKQEPKPSEQDKWLKAQQLARFDVLQQRNAKRRQMEKMQKLDRLRRPKEIFIDDKVLENLQIAPDELYITYKLIKNGSSKNTIVPSYVTESGFTEDIPGRQKVGAVQGASEFFVYSIKEDTVFAIKTDNLPGIFDKPDYTKDYPATAAKDVKKEKKPETRGVSFYGPIWSDDGKHNIVVVRSIDNKDRWLTSLDVHTHTLVPIDRQHDDAWIGGPGSGSFFGNLSVGFLSDNKTIWYQSEESGYSHLYTLDLLSKKKTALTSGKYEVQFARLSNDKRFFFLSTNETHPGERHFYKMPIAGGKADKITSLAGANEVITSPDEKWLAIRYSYTNKPWELYLQENKPGAKAIQITSSLSSEFKSYPWRDVELLSVKASDGENIYTRVFKPTTSNGAAVIFVHGAGYLQNAHKWWSSYFREYMFHNLLADKGYTVIDMDYRASAGYGRDWRTGIYRYMGGKDLTDHIDGAKWLVDQYGIDPKRIGIYGGSYGGFITLMAMFTTPDVFAAGAALRPVTDWAHYNHGYTASILNEPFADSLAYAKSSPLNFAAGLKGSLLICHGLIDTNVQVQDVMRLNQKLIELGKDNWEIALYPLEDHGFIEPSSWVDEYKRILKLFEQTLIKH